MSFYSTDQVTFRLWHLFLFRYQAWFLSNQPAPLPLTYPVGSQLTILAEQVKRRSILDKSVLEGTLMKARKKCGARTMQRGSVPGRFALYK